MNTRHNNRYMRSVLLLALLSILCMTGRASAQTYNLAKDFSIAGNPNGAWQYGQTPTRGGVFSPFTLGGFDAFYGVAYWSEGSLPQVTLNTTGVDVTLSTLKIPAYKIYQHPGPGGDNSVVRWIAPQTGIYSIDSSFTGIDFAYPTTTDVAVLRNSSEQLFAGDISSYNIPLPYFQIIYVTQGDTIDFSVGFGTNANYFGDATMTDAVITKRNNFKSKLDVSSIALYYGQTGNLTARLRKATSLESVQNAPITFKVDGVTVGTGTTDNTGLAAYPYTADESLAVGVHTLTAEFAGAGLITKSAKLTIRQTASSLSVSSAAGAPGASVNFKAKLKRKTDSQPLAGRDVSFSVDGVAVGTAVTDGTGVATLPYAIGESAIGTYTLVASYAGTIESLHNRVFEFKTGKLLL